MQVLGSCLGKQASYQFISKHFADLSLARFLLVIV